jgi:YVTN family beta-propeller protein
MVGSVAGVAITPDGRKAYVADVANGDDSTISVIDTATYRVVTTIPVARPRSVAIAVIPM